MDSILRRQSIEEDETIELDQITEINLFAGGGIPLEPDLIQMALSILNDPQLHVEKLFTSISANYLYQHLKGKVKTIPPITFFSNDHEEENGKFSFNSALHHMNRPVPY
jgi:hypothetical protein